VGNEELFRVKEQRNILHGISERKVNWIGHILRRNCLLIEGKIKEGIEVLGRRGRRSRKLLDDLKERRGYSHLKEESLDRSMCRDRFERIISMKYSSDLIENRTRDSLAYSAVPHPTAPPHIP
jgi:hypothetical protein